MAAPASGSQPSAGLTPEEQLAYIQVNQTGLARLALFLPEMTKHVRHICLNIQLNPYDCRICQETESTPWSFINDKIIADAIVELFDILSSWEERPGGLMLELNAFSPSDKTHWLKHAFVGAPGEVVPAQYARPTVHDPQHGWEHDRMVRPPCGDALRRPFQTSYLYFGSELATVPAVTKFLLRRQCRRQLEPWSVIQLFDKLPKLEDIQYEPWQLFKRSSQTPWDFGWARMLTYGSRLPSTVKNITVFEDFNETYLDAFKQDHGPNKWLSPDPVRRTNPRLGHAFAVRSLCLESLSVAFMIDAAHFLACCHRDWVWIRLKSLTLTSRYLSEDNATRTNKILGYAGRVAVSMPELEDMTLWNAGRGHACKFTWCRRDASISWRASWRLPLVRGVVNEWREVAGIYTDKQLTVHREVLTDDIPSHAYAIARLGLNHVVDATSLLQMLRENSGV